MWMRYGRVQAPRVQSCEISRLCQEKLPAWLCYFTEKIQRKRYGHNCHSIDTELKILELWKYTANHSKFSQAQSGKASRRVLGSTSSSQLNTEWADTAELCYSWCGGWGVSNQKNPVSERQLATVSTAMLTWNNSWNKNSQIVLRHPRKIFRSMPPWLGSSDG